MEMGRELELRVGMQLRLRLGLRLRLKLRLGLDCGRGKIARQRLWTHGMNSH